MMMMSGSRNRFPFTGRQWEELEQQALIFKYMVSGFPVPPQLLFSIQIKTATFDSLNLFSHPPPRQQHFGWKCYGGKKVDPEPGRCRRTDGKKWRCSKEAYPDSKYCERHMHRGKNRSRKPVEGHANSRPCLDNTNLLLYSHHTNTTSYGTDSSSWPLTITSSKQSTCSGLHSVEDDQEQPKKTVHRFFDEWPPQNRDKSPTRLSISIPTSSLHFHTPQC